MMIFFFRSVKYGNWPQFQFFWKSKNGKWDGSKGLSIFLRPDCSCYSILLCFRLFDCLFFAFSQLLTQLFHDQIVFCQFILKKNNREKKTRWTKSKISLRISSSLARKNLTKTFLANLPVQNSEKSSIVQRTSWRNFRKKIKSAFSSFLSLSSISLLLPDTSRTHQIQALFWPQFQ